MKAAVVIVISIGVLLGASVAVAFLSWRLRVRRLARLAEGRDGQRLFQEFRAALPGFSDSRALRAYEFVQSQVGVESFPVKFDDDLWQTLEIDQGNLLSALKSLVRAARPSLPRRG